MKSNTQAAKTQKYIKGSRIPLKFLFDYFMEGYTISDFLSSYPWIKKDDVKKMLEDIDKREDSSKYVIG